MNSKAGIRHAIQSQLKTISKTDLIEKSRLVSEKVETLCQSAKTVALFKALPHEINLTALMTKLPQTTILFPKCFHENEYIFVEQNRDNPVWNKGPFGVEEPKNEKKWEKEIDLIFVPGIAFDRDGNRIGFGKGIYDRLLKNQSAKKIAICFDCQVIDKIEKDPWDQPLDMIVTESRLIHCEQ